jgi:hypothetical protein
VTKESSMAQMIRTGSSDKTIALRQLLQARGFDPRDFDIEEDSHSGIGQLLGLVGGVLTLRRRSTGEIRVYACGAGSTWYATVAADLERGYFKGASPRRSFLRRLEPATSAVWF